jgi:hypothetical protein
MEKGRDGGMSQDFYTYERAQIFAVFEEKLRLYFVIYAAAHLHKTLHFGSFRK